MRALKTVGIVAGLILVTLAGITGWALESGEVAVLETRTPEGSSRSTRVWFAHADRQLWLEAAAPDSPWYLDVLETPELTFSLHGRDGRYMAEPVPGPEARDRVRALLHDKYGARDSWVGLFVDSTESVAVRLRPAP